MPDFTVQFRGLGGVISSLQGLIPKVQAAYARELYASAEEVMAAAKELTPVDTGNLRASGHVQPPTIENGVVSVVLGFGGPAGSGNSGESNTEDVGYATYVHEDLGANHAVGQAKYLEQPLMDMKAEIQQRLDDAAYEAATGKTPKRPGPPTGGPITPENPITDDDIPF